jgi:hypothetical protein
LRTALFVLAVQFGLAGTAFGQNHRAAVGAPAADLGAEINAWIAMLPTIGGYPAGTVAIPPGVYTQSTTVHINSPRVSVIGAGSGAVEITCTVNGDCFDIRLNPFVTDPQVGGQIGGFTLLGQASNPNAVGIHMGDITNTRLEDILIQGFTGANAAGMWWDNINGWIERTNVQRVNLNQNTTNYRFTNSGGPGNNSFCYNQWLDLRMNVGSGQKGIDFQSGYLCGSTLIMIINGAGTNKTYINLTGPSFWHNNLYDIKVENDAGDAVRLATAPGTEFSGTGLITNIQGPLFDSIGGSFTMYLPYILGAQYSPTSATVQWFTDQIGNLEVQAGVAASASSNFSSPVVALKSNCWNGSATAFDQWQMQNLLGSGANPISTLQFAFLPFGCTSMPELQVADGVGNGLFLSATAPGTTPRIRHDSDDNLVIDTGTANAALYLNTDNNKPVRLGTGGTTGANIPIVATLTTTGGTSTSLSMPGVTSSSHCSLTATNGPAAADSSTTYISAKTTDQITVTHTSVGGMMYDVLCTPN